MDLLKHPPQAARAPLGDHVLPPWILVPRGVGVGAEAHAPVHGDLVPVREHAVPDRADLPLAHVERELPPGEGPQS